VAEKPLVSVIITFLNAEKFLEETIESVFGQTYLEWELLLVDDGSRDKSTHIALNYQKNHPDKVRFLEHDRHANMGISASRNLGIRNARGKYIAMLDADDVWVENKLEQQVEILETYPQAGMVCGNSKYWHSWTADPRDLSLDRYIHDTINPNRLKLNSLIYPPLLLLLTLNGEIDPIVPSDIILRKEAIEHVGGFENIFKSMHEDQAFLAKIYLNSSVYVAASCWTLYRQHPDSCNTLAVKSGRQIAAELFYLNWLDKYLNEKRVTDPDILNALHRRLWNYKHPALNELKQTAIKNIKKTVKALAPRLLPSSARDLLISKNTGRRPQGWVDFGELRRLFPAGEFWGVNRGHPIDRYYMDRFFKENSDYIKGIVLEIGEDLYAYKYGKENVIKCDIVNISNDSDSPSVIYADSVFALHIPSGIYDCVILTRVLRQIYNLSSAIETLKSVLKPGGTVLAALPGICPNTDGLTYNRNWLWHFTSSSARELFEKEFAPENLEIKCYGNVLAATGLLMGLVSEDLTREELDYIDHRYEIIVGVRAVKSE
jgi:glycosyltransferase involved in cell wall biosynthesis